MNKKYETKQQKSNSGNCLIQITVIICTKYSREAFYQFRAVQKFKKISRPHWSPHSNDVKLSHRFWNLWSVLRICFIEHKTNELSTLRFSFCSDAVCQTQLVNVRFTMHINLLRFNISIISHPIHLSRYNYFRHIPPHTDLDPGFWLLWSGGLQWRQSHSHSHRLSVWLGDDRGLQLQWCSCSHMLCWHSSSPDMPVTRD